MADYSVLVQNEEGNEANTALTGMVNGRQVAVVVRTSSVPAGAAAAARWKANALLDAYLAMPAAKVNAGAVVIKREG